MFTERQLCSIFSEYLGSGILLNAESDPGILSGIGFDSVEITYGSEWNIRFNGFLIGPFYKKTFPLCHDHRLLLFPLSDLTEKHACVLANILIDEDRNYSILTKTGNNVYWFTKEHGEYEYLEFTNYDIGVGYGDPANPLRRKEYGVDAEIYWRAATQLKEWSYALPLYLGTTHEASKKTPIEIGLAIDKKKYIDSLMELQKEKHEA